MQYKATSSKGNHLKLIRFFATVFLILSIISSIVLLLAAFIGGIAACLEDSFIWLPLIWIGGAILALCSLYTGVFMRSLLCSYADAAENIYTLTSIAAAEYNEKHASQVADNSNTNAEKPNVNDEKPNVNDENSNVNTENSNVNDDMIDPFA